MTEVMTKQSLEIKFDNAVREIPLFNTPEYFTEDLYFVVKVGTRNLYLPLREAVYSGDAYNKSIVIRHNNRNYFLITYHQNLKSKIIIETYFQVTNEPGRTGGTCVLHVNCGNYILGLNFKIYAQLSITFPGDDPQYYDFLEVPVNKITTDGQKEFSFGGPGVISPDEVRCRIYCDISSEEQVNKLTGTDRGTHDLIQWDFNIMEQ